MGKSAVRFAAQTAAKNLVVPIRGVPKQPAYVRGGVAIQTSARLKKLQSCVATAMAGKSGSRVQIREAFAAAAKSCAGRG